MTETPRRPVGRPPIDPSDPQPSVRVCVRLPVKRYDAIYAQARAARMTIPEFVRAQLDRRDDHDR